MFKARLTNSSKERANHLDASSVWPTAVSGLVWFFNQQLEGWLTAKDSLPGINLIRMDMFSSIHEIIGSAEAYGFTNSTDAAIDSPDYDLAVDNYIFRDPVHPTTTTHELISDFVFARLLEAEGRPMSQSASAIVTVDVADVTRLP